MRLTNDQILGYIDGKIEQLDNPPFYDEEACGKLQAYKDVLAYIREYSGPL